MEMGFSKRKEIEASIALFREKIENTIKGETTTPLVDTEATLSVRNSTHLSCPFPQSKTSVQDSC